MSQTSHSQTHTLIFVKVDQAEKQIIFSWLFSPGMPLGVGVWVSALAPLIIDSSVLVFEIYKTSKKL